MSPSPAPWMSPSLPPDRLEPLEVLLNDASVLRAVWTGAKWWALYNGEVQPQAWRPLMHRELSGRPATG